MLDRGYFSGRESPGGVGARSSVRVFRMFEARPRPVRPEDCAMEVEKPAAGALCSDQRRLVELSTTEDKVEEGARTGIGSSAALALA